MAPRFTLSLESPAVSDRDDQPENHPDGSDSTGKPPREPDPLPDTLRARIESKLAADETIRVSIVSDMRFDGSFGESWIGATDRQLISASPNGGTGPDVRAINLADIREIEITELSGCGEVKVKSETSGDTFCLFSKSLNPTFANLRDELEPLLKTAAGDREPPSITSNVRGKHDKRCEKCGHVIPRWTGVCPNCLNQRKLLTRLLTYSLRFWKLGLASLIILLVSTFIGLTPPMIMAALIDDVLNPAFTAASGDSTTTVEPGVFGLSARKSLALLVGLLLGIGLSGTILGAIRGYLMATLGQSITYHLRQQVYHHLHRLSLNFYNERQTGTIMASVTHDINRLQGFLSSGLQDVIRNILTIIIITGFLFYLNAPLAVLVMIPTPLIVISTLKFGRYLRNAYTPLWRRWAAVSALLADVIPGIRVVKAFAQERREVDRFDSASHDLFHGELRAAKLQSLFTPTMTFLTSIGMLIVWWVGGNKVLGAELRLGAFVAFTQYIFRFYGPVEALCRLNHSFQRAATSAERVFDVLDTQPEVGDRDGAVPMPPIEGRVEFDHVFFAYEKGRPVIKDLTFTAEPGEMIGLAGHSGAGKSTMINLICRFYDADDGAIRIDGHDVRDVKAASLREQIGVVLQDPYLFTGSIAENIAYGNPDATLEQIIAAARAANAHEFIMRTPHAYDSVLGERGVKLSGGERQRMSIARAILRDPRILILDEATASMDTETEAKIQEALERLVKGRTTFAIAHRLSTLRHANRLLIIEKGELAEIGTHDELVAQDGIYARLVRMQTEMSRIRAL